MQTLSLLYLWFKSTLTLRQLQTEDPKVEGYWNYDKSEFDSPSVLSTDDDKLESIYKNLS